MADKQYCSKDSTKSSQSTSKNKDLVEKVLIAHDIQRCSADYNQPPPLPDSDPEDLDFTEQIRKRQNKDKSKTN